LGHKRRVERPSAVYRLLNRDDRRESSLKDDADRKHFVETLGEACTKTNWLNAYLDFKWQIATGSMTRPATNEPFQPAARTAIT